MPETLPPESAWRVHSKLWTFDWVLFFNGQIWKLQPGIDFHEGDTKLMRHRAYYVAKISGVTIRTQINKDGSLIIQATSVQPPPS